MATCTRAARSGRMPGATVVVDKNAINMPRTGQKFMQPLQVHVVNPY